MVGATIHSRICYLLLTKEIQSLPVNFVWGSLFLNLLDFWALDILKILIFLGNCYLTLNKWKQ